MVVFRIARQAAAVIGAVGLTVPILTAPGSAASATGTPGLALASSASTTTTVPGCPTTTTAPGPTTTLPGCTTTTTTVPRSTTTTTRPRPTTTTRPPGTTTATTAPRSTTTTTTVPRSTTTTTTRPPSPASGVPSVPVGGPAVKPTKPGAAGAPPANPTAILTAVQADLSQVSAIQQYARARSAVNSSRQGVAAATAGVERATAAERQARARARHAQANVAQAATRVSQLALAAYMGLGYVTPAAGPVSDQPSGDGTVSTPGGLTGSAALDALTLVQVVAVQERKDLVASHAAVARAARAVEAATAGTASAQADLAGAEMQLSASQQTLSLMTRAATTPGLAATLDLPSPTSPPTTTAPARGPSGPTTVPASRYVESDASAPLASSPTILGHTVLSAAEMARWFASTREKANVTVPMAQLTQDYVAAGQQTGVRADLAFAQSIVETASFTFPSYGQLTGKDDNFAGIGACDTCAHGWNFKNAATGVGAQMELLEAYASPKPVATPLLGRSVGVGGCCSTWLALAGKWASSTSYGISILTVYQDMLNWVIPERLVAAGLLAAPKPAPATPAPTPAKSAGPASPLTPSAPTTATAPGPSTTASGSPPPPSG